MRDTGMKLLVCNAGSTSLKFRLFDMPEENTLAVARIERIGSENKGVFHYTRLSDNNSIDLKDITIAGYSDGINYFLRYLLGGEYGVLTNNAEIECVGFKTVLAKGYYGVHELTEPVMDAMREYTVVAPAHNRPYIEVIKLIEKLMPQARRVGVFETNFHRTIPLARKLYGVPYEWYEKYGFQRLGYHGASHTFVSQEIATREGGTGRLISCHLGGSGSICAIENGKSVDTSFGFSLQTGLIHANRTGDCDPYVFPLMERFGLTEEEVMAGLTKHGGLLGISGVSNDLRDIEKAANEGNERAQLAIDVFCSGIIKFVGSFYIELGGLDHLVFTGGIGENSALIRKKVCEALSVIGVKLDPTHNEGNADKYLISAPTSSVKVHCVATNEELVVARQSYQIISRS